MWEKLIRQIGKLKNKKPKNLIKRRKNQIKKQENKNKKDTRITIKK